MAFAVRLTHPAVAPLLFPALWLVLQGSSAVVPTTEESRVAAEGSSILMQAPDVEHMNVLEWEYTGGSTSKSLLQYFASSQSLTVHPAYLGRVVFHPGNGSMLLQSLQESDGGIYKATVDLMQNKTRKTLLRVISKSKGLRVVFSGEVLPADRSVRGQPG